MRRTRQFMPSPLAHKAGVLGALVALALLAGPPDSAVAEHGNYRLTKGAAKHYTKKALKRKRAFYYRSAYAKKVGKCRRLAPRRVRCKDVSWILGDLVFYGKSVIWLTHNNRGQVIWNYAYRIKRLNEYCWLVEDNPKSECTKVYTVK